jgi:hypothetical protein
MVTRSDFKLVGIGIYSVPEASRLTGLYPRTIRRWIRGYTYSLADGPHWSPEVVTTDVKPIDGSYALSFRDLIEVRFVHAFRKHGVSWKTLRKASECARAMIGTTHPFSTRKFHTDGRTILASIDATDAGLLDVIKNQYVFREVIAPYLKGLELSNDEAIRWWPLERRGRVVLDPTRNFGQPTVNDEGVPTAALYRAFLVEGAVDPVARWFQVKPRSVEAAIEFEKQLAAA